MIAGHPANRLWLSFDICGKAVGGRIKAQDPEMSFFV